MVNVTVAVNDTLKLNMKENLETRFAREMNAVERL